MKILFVCEQARGGDGWSRYTADLVRCLRERGHTVIICCRTDAEGDYPVLPPATRLLSRPFVTPCTALRLQRIIKKEQPDIVHCTVEPYAQILAFLPSSVTGRTVMTIHGTYGIRPLIRPLSRIVFSRSIARAGAIITVSAYTKQRLTDELRVRGCARAMDRAERAIVIPNGIALPTWNSLTHHEGPKNILTVGGIKPRKGILEAVEACAAYKRRSTTSFVFTIVGSVHELEYEQLLQRRIAALGLQDTVRIAGFVSDAELMELYKNADLYLMPVQTTPDVFEGFGLVYLEANAFGVPCIGPDKSGAAEAIEEGTSGYHVNVDDGEQIAERMAWILDERRIDPASCRSWAERHSLEVVCTRTEAVYNTLSRI